MLKYLLSLLFVITLSCGANAQSDSALLNKKDITIMNIGEEQTKEPDDEFNIFLMVFAIGFMCAALGAVMAGAFAVCLFLGVTLLLTTIGIVSASLLIGLYKRSLQAGFKSLLLITGSLLGIAFGLFILWLINLFLHLHMEGYQVLLVGAGGGLLGGLVLGFITYRMIKAVLRIAMQKLKIMN